MNQNIKSRTIWLRQRYKLKTPDAIIAATAIEFQVPLISSDNDFSVIKELDFLFLEK
ncbi:PIN domain-containing protein [Emticicia aquatilis]|uniref:PIN domain-containing protein n=1 Tax=Emticicia aquatilis TaxID=1537369 RepID=UPI001668BDD2|nr:PIN domain-containing protein [Emticicia aquatilis]